MLSVKARVWSDVHARVLHHSSTCHHLICTSWSTIHHLSTGSQSASLLSLCSTSAGSAPMLLDQSK